MPRNDEPTAPAAAAWRQSASEIELIVAAADLASAAETAREAGRPVTAEAIRNEARELEAQRQQLLGMAAASRDCLALQTDDPAVGCNEA